MNRHTREELRDDMRRASHATRRTADEMARMYGGCDDPLAASTVFPLHEQQKLWTNWREFARVVCAPIVEREGDDYDPTVQEAMRRFRTQSPYSLAVSLYMADKALERAEADR